MEKWYVIGFRKVNFNDPSGSNVSGYSLFLSRSGVDGVTGDECQKVFMSDRKITYRPELGDTVQLIYNRFGKLADVILA